MTTRESRTDGKSDLRDHYAGLVLNGLIASWGLWDEIVCWRMSYPDRAAMFAHNAYLGADAMLAERSKAQGTQP